MSFKELSFNMGTPREAVMEEVRTRLDNLGLPVVEGNLSLSWGGFFWVNEHVTQKFINQFFPLQVDYEKIIDKKQPRILIIEPEETLPYRTDDKTESCLRFIVGQVRANRGTRIRKPQQRLSLHTPGSSLKIPTNTTYSLIASQKWAVLAEVLQQRKPSD